MIQQWRIMMLMCLDIANFIILNNKIHHFQFKIHDLESNIPGPEGWTAPYRMDQQPRGRCTTFVLQN